MGMLLRRHEGYGKNITKTSDVNPVAKATEKKSEPTKAEKTSKAKK